MMPYCKTHGGTCTQLCVADPECSLPTCSAQSRSIKAGGVKAHCTPELRHLDRYVSSLFVVTTRIQYSTE
ncbi:hypothetical protein Q1695_001745 [Nippostrongylus brasiliensis]|nr:hypothetical protein Q1695_001745 [Nippostrongylus brasiliensis]